MTYEYPLKKKVIMYLDKMAIKLKLLINLINFDDENVLIIFVFDRKLTDIISYCFVMLYDLFFFFFFLLFWQIVLVCVSSICE